MTSESKIVEVQKRYFDFCISLIKKIPQEIGMGDDLMLEAFLLRDEMEKEIVQSLIELKNDKLTCIEQQINVLKTKQDCNGQ
jgi:hypothetical protein